MESKNKKAEYQAEYYKKNKDKIAKQKAEYYKKNKDKIPPFEIWIRHIDRLK